VIPLPFLQSGATFEGYCMEKSPFVLSVSSKKKNDFSGTIAWPNFDTTTKISGTMDGKKVEFHETHYVQGNSVVIPREYVGKISKKKDLPVLCGNFSGPAGTKGDFEIQMT